MSIKLLGVLLAAVPAFARAGEERTPCPIFPHPKEYHDSGTVATLQPAEAAAIVIGTKATEPERYAAEYLQTQIERRFHRRLPVYVESELPVAAQQVFLLGQVETNTQLMTLCRDQKIELNAESPGHDGFVIRCLDDGLRQVILIGGSNPRGVIYGQHAFFDLLRSEGDRVVFPVVSVRDWPSIPWRGRPHSVLKQHLVPGALDAYLRARLNFTDVRDDPDVEPTIIFPARKASMGFPAGKPIDRPLVERAIRESHRRGLFVYGTVSCGVSADKTDDVLKTFEELISLGVDGLWISFDDVGAGENAANVVRHVLDLGNRHDMTGRKIAITPPDPDYKHIDTTFNREAATWGLTDAQWLFTRVPCADDLKMARQIGISRAPGWWHNLVSMRGGFLHNGNVLCPLRKDWGPAYVNPQPLTNGWHRPTYEQLRDAEKHTSCVLLWGVIGGWPEEYQLGDLGHWSWNPVKYDWQASCDASYRLLYGPGQVETARAFDAKLTALKDLFHLPPRRFWAVGEHSFVGWPCRLKRLEDRPKALALLDELDALSIELSREAPKETAIDSTRLVTIYLAPMRDTLDYARRMTLLEYPEYTAADLDRTMISLIEAGMADEAKSHLAATRERLAPQLDRIQAELADLKQVDEYVAMWRQRTSGTDYWRELAVRRRTRMSERFRRLIGGDVASFFPYKEQVTADTLDALFVCLDKPPAGKVLTTIDAAEWLKQPFRFSGAFCAGPFDWKGQSLAAIAYPRRIPSKVDDAGELYVELAVPEFTGRLMLDAFVNDTRLENRYPRFRYLQLWVNDRLIWEEDIARSHDGKEWVSLDVTELAKSDATLKLRFQVIDKRPVGDHLTITFLGPIRLRAIPGQTQP